MLQGGLRMHNHWFRPTALKAAAVAAAALMLPATSAQAASPFKALHGSWSGSGQIQFEGGQAERLRCTAYYTNSGGEDVLGLAIRCASASNRFEIRGRLSYSGGRVTGTWEERTFNASGTATGLANDSRVSLRLAGAIPGSMNVSVSQSRQSVAISSQGTALKAVRIGLRRR